MRAAGKLSRTEYHRHPERSERVPARSARQHRCRMVRCTIPPGFCAARNGFAGGCSI